MESLGPKLPAVRSIAWLDAGVATGKATELMAKVKKSEACGTQGE